MTTARSQFAGYVAAILLSGLALVGRRLLLGEEAAGRLPLLPFVPAVLIASWIGGLFPGLLATILGLIGGVIALRETDGLAFSTLSVLRLALFAAGGAAIAALAERAHHMGMRLSLLDRSARSSRDWLEAIVSGAPSPFITLDRDWRIVAASDRFIALRGGDRGAIVGRTLWDACPDFLTTELERQLRRVASQGGEASFEGRDERSGRWFSYHVYASAPGVAAVMRDVTADRRAMDDLRHERELLRRLIDALPVMITMYDPAGRALRVNREFERLLGYRSEEAEAGPFVDATVPDPIRRQTFRDFLESGTDGWMDVPMRTRSGREIQTSWANLRLSDHTLVGIGLDLTARLQAETAGARLAAIVESSEDAIVSKTLDGIISSWNHGAERLFGYTAAEAVGQPITIIIPPDRRDEERRILDAIQRGERVEPYETVRIAKDGRPVDLSVAVSPIRDEQGRIIGASKVARDISARRQAERERLEDEKRRDDFLTTLAHELRNPLAPIRSALELLRMTASTSEPLRHVHEMLDRQVRHLVRVLDDALDVSRLVHGRIELQHQRLDFVDVVRTALDRLRPVIESRHQHLTVSLPEEPLPVEGDLARLTQIAANLVQNATKFTHEGGEIAVAARRDDGRIVLSVKDNGRGIDPGFLPEVFGLFVQDGRAPEHETPGLGVGLTLVRRLVELHGGDVEAHSEGVGRGSEFIVRLPASDRPAAAPAPSAPASPGGSLHLPGPVLVVDDNHDAAESMAMLLRHLGAEVVVAHDGTDALAALSEHSPSVVLLDIGLPGMDGYQVAEMIRAHPFLRDTRLVALTGWGHDEARRRAKESGFEHHLVKPVDVEVLRDLLMRIAQPQK